jgi:hypothetical protein
MNYIKVAEMNRRQLPATRVLTASAVSFRPRALPGSSK